MKAYSKLMGVVVVMTILVSAISLPFFALAQDYTLLEKSVLPAGQASDGKVDFATYIESGFKTFLAVVVIIAIVMLTASGLQYITAGSGGGKGEAKNRAMAALLGLLIALSAYLILRTINPDLVDLTLDIANRGGDAGRPGAAANPPQQPTDPNAGGNNPQPGSGELLNEQDARKQLDDAGIKVNNPNPCPEGESFQDYTERTGGHCTTLEGIPDTAIDGVIDFKNKSGCNNSVMVTGGTEKGHSTHGQGKAVLDIDDTACVNSYIVDQGNFLRRNNKGWNYYELNGDIYVHEGDHYHIIFTGN